MNTLQRALQDIMQKRVIEVDAAMSVAQAAKRMRDHDISNLVVTREGAFGGVLTDRDLVVRCLAEDQDARETEVGSLCRADEEFALGPYEPVSRAVDLMKRHALHRIPVMRNGRAVGIVSLGDLAIELERDPRATLDEPRHGRRVF